MDSTTATTTPLIERVQALSPNQHFHVAIWFASADPEIYAKAEAYVLANVPKGDPSERYLPRHSADFPREVPA